jgi:peroxiredoxin
MALTQLTGDLELFTKFDPEKINILEHVKGKKVILMGLPGAFTPTW